MGGGGGGGKPSVMGSRRGTAAQPSPSPTAAAHGGDGAAFGCQTKRCLGLRPCSALEFASVPGSAEVDQPPPNPPPGSAFPLAIKDHRKQLLFLFNSSFLLQGTQLLRKSQAMPRRPEATLGRAPQTSGQAGGMRAAADN